MIDRDLAELYGVETRSLNQAVKRNIERFPERFMFQLTKEEMFSIESCSRSQFVILNEKKSRGSNIKYLPYAFTEQGIYMLMTVLRGKTFLQGIFRGYLHQSVRKKRFLRSGHCLHSLFCLDSPVFQGYPLHYRQKSVRSRIRSRTGIDQQVISPRRFCSSLRSLTSFHRR